MTAATTTETTTAAATGMTSRRRFWGIVGVTSFASRTPLRRRG